MRNRAGSWVPDRALELVKFTGLKEVRCGLFRQTGLWKGAVYRPKQLQWTSISLSGGATLPGIHTEVKWKTTCLYIGDLPVIQGAHVTMILPGGVQ